MSTLTQFTVTGKEKDDFYGFNITGQTNQVINRVVTKNIPSSQEQDDLLFAWRVVRLVRSNAIVVASSGQSIGIGAGQMNRIASANLALKSPSNKPKGAVLSSDGFFPFNDTVKLAGEYGIKAIIQPGGSLRDKESIDMCNSKGMSMIFTQKRHFLH